MAEVPKVASNCLSHLLGDYNSDSDNDDAENMDKTVDKFFTELNTTQAQSTNWTQCFDKNTGHPYYWNTLTKDVTWDMPAEYQKFLDSNTETSSKHKKNAWTTCYTDDEVTPYYVNEFTRIVSWDRPEGLLEDPPAPKVPAVIPKEKVMIQAITKPTTKVVKSKVNNSKVKRRKYPFDNDSLEQEKIELISSYTTKTDSSSDEDASKKQKKTFEEDRALKLVATEYNSDDNSNDANKRKRPHGDDDLLMKSRKVNTFASIITGGRSPEHEQNILEEPPTSEPPQIPVENVDEIELNAKAFKRKRRIEFKKQPIPVVLRTNTAPVDSDETEATTENGSATETTVTNLYSNFQKAESVDKTDRIEETDKVVAVDASVSATENNSGCEDNRKVKDEIQVLKLIIEAKLKFLCDGRPDVPPVQAIMIQLETLLEAYDDGALQPDYIQRWLEGISNDLKTLEKDAAPEGWKCLWNRKNSQYCYKHLTTGTMTWEYPDTAASNSAAGNTQTDDDEMDICTTPPPNVDEQLNIGHGSTRKSKDNGMRTPKPPKWDVVTDPIAPPPPQISNEPPPPGIDAVEFGSGELQPNKNKPSEVINSELASFYSDLASIDSVTEAVVSDDVVITDNAAAADEAVADLNKKKKRKIKKLQPWRSGNLETWISKWQKAQKELDN